MLGERPIARGENKDIYEIQGQPDRVIAILRIGEIEVLNTEIQVLQKIEAQGLQTIEVLGTTTHRGKPAIVMKKYGTGSQKIVHSIKSKPQIVDKPDIRWLNQTSITDLSKILSILQRKNIYIQDLQFLIAEDGNVYIADAIDIIFNAKPEAMKRNEEMISLLINMAEQKKINKTPISK